MDMGLTPFQYCFHPSLRMDNGGATAGETAAAFFLRSLTEGLRELDEYSVAENSVSSLRWAAQAAGLIKRAHSELLPLLAGSDLPTSPCGGGGWLDEYMRDTAAVLDLCNLLKSAVSWMGRYRMAVDLAARDLDRGSSVAGELEWFGCSCRDRFGLEGEFKPAEEEEAAERQKKKSGVSTAMTAVRRTVAVLSSILVSTLAAPPHKLSSCFEPCCAEEEEEGDPELKPVMAALLAIASRFREEATSKRDVGGVAVVELEVVESLVKEIRSRAGGGEAEDAVVAGNVELLREKALALQEGVDAFGAAMDEVFEVVIGGRNQLLGALRGEHYS